MKISEHDPMCKSNQNCLVMHTKDNSCLGYECDCKISKPYTTILTDENYLKGVAHGELVGRGKGRGELIEELHRLLEINQPK